MLHIDSINVDDHHQYFTHPITPPSPLPGYSSPSSIQCSNNIHIDRQKTPLHLNFIIASSSPSTGPPASPGVQHPEAVDVITTTTTTIFDFSSSSFSSLSTQSSPFSSFFLSSKQEPAELSIGSPQEQNQVNQLITLDRPFHPIIQILREQELGRHVLVLAIPMTVGLFSFYNPVNAPLALRMVAVALAVGFVGIWNGILLRRSCHEASNVIELLGISFMLLAFFGFIASFLPLELVWIPCLCWVLSLLVLAVAICFRGTTVAPQPSTAPSPTPPLLV